MCSISRGNGRKCPGRVTGQQDLSENVVYGWRDFRLKWDAGT